MTRSNGLKDNQAFGFAAVFAMVICCAAPVIIAGGAIGAIGAFVSNPLVIAVGVILIGAAFVWATRRLRERREAPHRALAETRRPPGETEGANGQEIR